MSKIGNIAYITKLAGFEHTEYIQGNCSHSKLNDYIPLFIGKTVRDGMIDTDFDWYIPMSLSAILPRSQLRKKCLVLPYVGSVGDLAIYDGSYPAHLGSNIAKIELNDDCGYSEEFIYYFLKSPFGQKVLLRDIQGAVQKNITMESIRNVELPNISEEMQNMVVNSLSLIDKKIENNKIFIMELESMAKTLYDYWFLQFEFPNEEGKPYKSSGGKMVYNKELKREIPEGWKVENVKSHCKITWGQCPDGANILPINTDEDSMPYCSGAGDMRSGLLVDCQAKTNASRRTANINDILMSVAGSIGAVCYCDKTISLGRAAVAFSPKRNEELFTLMSVKSFSDRMKIISSGSIQKVVNDNHLNDMNLVFDDAVLVKFSKYNSLLNKMIFLCRENQELASLRDFLLPMLMNGQVTFKED